MKRLTDITLSCACVLLLTACSMVTDQYEEGAIEQGMVKDLYISFTIAVNDGGQTPTRATWWPAGGESGNGWEYGFQRENTVTGITLMLFKVPAEDASAPAGLPMRYAHVGFSTDATTKPTLDLIRYYPVTESNVLEDHVQGEGYNFLKGYSTGKQLLDKNHKLDLTAKYYAVAICNCYPSELSQLIEGVSTIDDIKDLTVRALYSGHPTGSAEQCESFITALEDYTVLDFANPENYTIDGEGDIVYNFEHNSIYTERMAARIDFWAYNAINGNPGTETGVNDYATLSKDKNGVAYPEGYLYKVYNSSDVETDDRFVITHITPFNLSNDVEYIFKRCTYVEGGTGNIVPGYLMKEDGWPQICVVDPHTIDKSGVVFNNPLTGLLGRSSFEGNSYRKSIASLRATISSNNGVDGKTGGFNNCTEDYSTGSEEEHNLVEYHIGPAEDVLICYATENTLAFNAPLLPYATGIAIEGKYYHDNDATSTPETRIYYGFIRHASRNFAPGSFDALRADEYDTEAKFAGLKNDVKDGSVELPMNFGVVRNNIYRIHINKVYQRGAMSLRLVVKKWDKFTHEVIYM